MVVYSIATISLTIHCSGNVLPFRVAQAMDFNIPAFRRGLPSRCLLMDVLSGKLTSDLTPLFQLSDSMLQYYSNVELAQELNNQKCKCTVGFLTLCPCCPNFSGKTVHLVARQAFENPWRPGCRNVSKCDDRKGLRLKNKPSKKPTWSGYWLCFVQASCMAYSSTLRLEAKCSANMSVDFQWTTQHHIPEDITLLC
jgi:hypothetical protein